MQAQAARVAEQSQVARQATAVLQAKQQARATQVLIMVQAAAVRLRQVR
jgi:hypothetical protein